MAAANRVESAADMARLDGQQAAVHGIYRPRTLPVKGDDGAGRPQDRAVLELADGSEVWLEPLDAVRSQRPAGELRRCDGRNVRVTGTVHAVMPARGQSLLAPCIADISAVELEQSL